MNIKRYFTIVVFTLISLSAFATTEINTEKQKLSYAMGTYFALSVTQQEMAIDVPAFIQAVEDALKGKEPQISMKDMQNIITQYKKTVDKQQSDAIAMNRQAGNTFLAENKKKEDVIESPTGLQYKIIKQGKGEKPATGSKVTVHYKGSLIDGTVFDSSYERGQPATLSLAQVIKGWREALPMMEIGSKWQIYVPSELAYGDRSASRLIGPASTLIFDIELISID